jgi:hypothetical protein
MTLTDDQLLEILKKKPNKELMRFGREQRKRSRMHMYGVGMETYLTMIEGFEKPWLREIRTKYVQSNKDLFARLIKPFTKIFTARGGSSYYNLDGKENQIASELDNNVMKNTSTKKWLENYWKTHLLDDPMGIIFMEIDNTGRTYPTYKSVDDIEEYHIVNGEIEYVIFPIEGTEKLKLGLEDKGQVYRVVDDMFDRIVILDNESITEVDGQTFPNYFGYVPAVINSPFINPDGLGFISPFYWVFDLADQYLLKISIRITHELRHGFPKYYEYADDCIECKGTGKLSGKIHSECKGTGKKILMHVSDVKLLEYPTKDNPALKDAPGGYIEPSEIFWNIVSTGLAELEERINQTMWGAKSGTKLKPGLGLSAAPNGIVTATEVMDNRQPEIDSLNMFCDAAEIRDKFIVDSLVTIMMYKPDYIKSGGCSKNYGRRFLIEDADKLLERYTEARAKGVSPGILYGLYEQYLEAKHQSDGVSLSLHKKLMKIEPFMHYTLSEMKLAGFSENHITAKIYYGEWLAQVNNNKLVLSSIGSLKKDFAQFVEDMGKVVETVIEPVNSSPK